MTHTIHEYNHGGVCIFCGYEKKAMAESIQDQRLHNKKPELHNNSGENSEKVTSIQDQKRVSQKEPIFEVTVKMKNGEEIDMNPVVNITIDNTYHEYDFDPREIESITFKEVQS